MGYKLAGCEVLGCVEIDPKMNEIYVNNHHEEIVEEARTFIQNMGGFEKFAEWGLV